MKQVVKRKLTWLKAKLFTKRGAVIAAAMLVLLLVGGVALARGKATPQSAAREASPNTSVQPEIQKPEAPLKQKSETFITYHYQDKVKKFSPQEITSWYVLSGDTYVLSDTTLTATINQTGTGFGITVLNVNEAVAATKQALQDLKPLDFTLTAKPKPVATTTYRYCTKVLGVDAGNLPELDTKLATVYADDRGWAQGGKIAFVKAASGCQLVVWLSAADQVPTFGKICDNIWSCTVHPNVILNYDRWMGASEAWNATGGSLDDYRTMVINHETGHWLGFGHRHCGGAGQQAPVMQQQSISLEGCVANPWPLSAELASR